MSIKTVPAKGEYDFLSNCPHCGTLIEFLSNVQDDSPPTPGCVSVCIKCRNWNIFDDDMKLRQVTTLDIAAMSNEMILMLGRVGKAMAAVHKSEKRSV